MFLKRLEIIGFKSFAERIGIDFVRGVTAVVGPNGSGKSNITDAIRWVLGEQSVKSLRGSKMEDVIFSGSDSRKALNFAEVTLVLDNSEGLFPLDYTEISVSRRVFRSGESVYLLNGQQCRLKDINDVFIDSGLGKEAFSIISQGRVDEILNSKPENRRSIFDEAAGVLKYRTRKQKAEHKLFETSDNLDRVLDILKELDVRIEPLRERSEAAKRHAVLSDEVRESDIMLLNYDAGYLRVDIQQKLEEAKEYQVEKDALLAAIKENEDISNTYKEHLEAVEQSLETWQQQLVKASAETEKWEGRRLLSAEKERNASFQIERIQAELTSNEQSYATLQKKLKASRQKLKHLTKEYDDVAEKMAEVTQILKRSAKETAHEIEELKTAYIDGLNEEAMMRNELKNLEERLIGEKFSSERTSKQTTSLRNKLKELLAEKKVKAQHIKEIKQKITEANEHYSTDAKLLKKTEETLQNKQELLQKAHNKQHEMQGRLRALQSMEEDFSGFYSGVKEVLLGRKAGKLKGIKGAVAELITVDVDYVKAVETALGGAMQHIVTTSEADARKAIGYLKAQNKGRATFLPLDVMRPRKIETSVLQSVKQHPEFIGTADRLVQVEASYRMITENLLGNVIIAKTLTGAGAIAKSLNYRYRVVTIDGDIVNAGGSLTGGGAQGRASVFSRKAELETLQSQLQEMSASIKHAATSIGDTKMKIAELMEKTEGFRKAVEKLQTEIRAAEARVRESDIAIASAESELSTIEIGQRGAETAGSELEQKKKTLEATYVKLQQTLEASRKEIETLERLAADWRNEEAALKNNLTNYRERTAVLREQIAYKRSEIKELEEAEVITKEKVTLLQQELSYLNGEDETENLSAEEILEFIAKAAEEKERLEKTIATSREERTAHLAEIEKQAAILHGYRENAEKVTRQHNDVTIQLSRLEVSYEAMTQKLLTEYGLQPDFQLILDFDAQKTRMQLMQLKEELAELGPVNPSAIQEYEEVAKRHEFLTTQRNDLLEAKSTLHEAMSEMDQEMSMRFSSTFDAVQNRFRHVFKDMFGGGNADLVLTDPNNMLETGVEIIARPPGKKMQNLSLLSGGERALTAISLLFAIIEVRPVPFCILDEVEAALDEANVLRYSNYLKKFSATTQFIVITHRKGTMEGADVLYGITMQESGVSKLISVKLSEVPEEAMI